MSVYTSASDQDQKPHTPGGCGRCLGAVTIVGDSVTKNPAYYIIAHASKFVRPGSKRVASNYLENLPNVAFLMPSGKIVLIVFNDSDSVQPFNIKLDNKQISSGLNAGATGTFVF